MQPLFIHPDTWLSGHAICRSACPLGSLSAWHPLIVSSRPLAALSSCPPIPLSRCLLVPLSSCRPASPPPRLPVMGPRCAVTRACYQAASCLFALLLLTLLAACAPATVLPTPAPTPTPVLRLTAVTVPGAQIHLLTWIRLYEENHPGVVVEMRADTFARVQEAVAGGSVDIAALDQEPLSYYQGVLTATQIADEPIALVVHSGNVIESLSSVVLQEVLAGRVGDWEEIGGVAGPLQVYLLPDSAGAVQYLDQVVLAGQRLAPQAIVCASSASLLRMVEGDSGGIGVLPLNAVTRQVRVLGVDGFLPSDGHYPWRMPLFLSYGPGAPLQAREFVQYIARQR